ncbi:MAG TPA: hypothetical protein VJJ81_02220 [Candidatus Babeliales bacterium]|nr:hypothetical protein [Candidatus Babeliales bacterium]
MFKSLRHQNLIQIVLVLTSYQVQAVISAPAPIVHHPEASFRVNVTKEPTGSTITTTITPADDHLQVAGSTTAPNNSKANTARITKKTLTTKTKKTTATPQVLVAPAPTSMGAIILMGGNNNIKDRSEEALVVLIPYDSDQLPIVNEFTKWLYEQQTVNFRKLEDAIVKQALNLKLVNVKSVTISRQDLGQYITSTGTSFEHAVNLFAEALGGYEKIMSQLQFNDLKKAALTKMQNARN